MTEPQAERALAFAINEARSAHRSLASRGEAWGVTPAGAYRVQATNLHGRATVGYKLGLLSPAKQAQMGIAEPIHGHVLPSMLHTDSIRLSTFIEPRIEPEIAVVLARDVAAGAAPGEVARAIGGFFLGLDVLDTVWKGYQFTLPEVIADNTSGGGFALGPRKLAQAPAGDLALLLNGEVVTGGPVAALGDPVRRLTQLANRVGHVPAGHVVFLGSPAQAVPAVPGVLEVRIGWNTLTLRLEA